MEMKSQKKRQKQPDYRALIMRKGQTDKQEETVRQTIQYF